MKIKTKKRILVLAEKNFFFHLGSPIFGKPPLILFGLGIILMLFFSLSHLLPLYKLNYREFLNCRRGHPSLRLTPIVLVFLHHVSCVDPL
jgi:hypothetical protein